MTSPVSQNSSNLTEKGNMDTYRNFKPHFILSLQKGISSQNRNLVGKFFLYLFVYSDGCYIDNNNLLKQVYILYIKTYLLKIRVPEITENM
jgi:hypothetical protein